MPFTILLIDNDPGSEELARGLREEDCEVTAVCEASEGRLRLEQGLIDGILVNPALFPGLTCQALVQHLCRQAAERPAVLFLTPTGSLESCRRCPILHEGRIDCVDSPADGAEVISRLLWLLRCGRPKPPRRRPRSPLSPREQEVLCLLRGGLPNREIAARLFITEKVVEKHIARLCGKLGVANRTLAVALSYRQSLFTR